MAHPGLARREGDEAFPVPELAETGQTNADAAALQAGVVIDALDPLQLALAAGELGLATEATAEIGEDVVVIPRLEQRLHHLVHGQNAGVGVGAPLLDVIPLIGGGGGQHDIGEAAAGGPLVIDADHGFQLAPGRDHLVAILLVVERVVAAEHRHLHVGVGDGLAVEGDLLARIEDAVDETGHRNEFGVTLPVAVMERLDPGNDRAETGHDGAAGGDGARPVVVPAKAVTAPRQADLANHRGQYHQHPGVLLAMVHPLHAPATDKLGAATGHGAGQFAYGLGRDATDGGGPLGILHLTVAGAQQVGQELVEAGGVVFQERLVVALLAVEAVGDAQHQRHVGLRIQGYLIAIEVLLGLGFDRIDADDPDLALGHLLFELCPVVVDAVIRHQPAHLQVLDGIRAPDDDSLAVLQHQRPGGLLLVHLHGPRHVGQDHLGGAGGVVTGLGQIGAVQVHGAPQHGAGGVQLAHRLPAGVTGIEGARAMGFLHPLQLVIEEVQRLGPGDPHEAVLAAFAGVGLVALAQPVQPHHGVADAGGVVDHFTQGLEHLGGVFVMLERQGLDPAAVHDPGTEGAPVGAGLHQLVAGLGGHHGATEQGGADQGRGTAGQQATQKTTTGNVDHLVIPLSDPELESGISGCPDHRYRRHGFAGI